MIRILIQPARQWFGRRQWKFEIRAANGERIDPRDTYNNRAEASKFWEDLITGSDPVQLVIYNRGGEVEKRIDLR